MSNPSPAVFLSYASQDADAARKICDALRAAGLEVWFDQSELRGGDAWDQKIRKQIRECALFVPVISANTQSRPEGYFRLEWKLGVDRSHLMADDQPFLVPVVIDDTPQSAARVPDKFQEVQWTRLVMTETPAAFAARVRSLVSTYQTGPALTRAGQREARGSRRARGPRWWLVFPVVGVAVGIYFIIDPAGRSNRSRETKPTAPAAAPISKARELGNRAKALMQKYESGAEDFAAAENLLKTALELDPNDAELWVTSSLLNFAFGSRGFDRSPARNTAARSHAERALKLAPDSIEGLFALGRWQRDFDEPAVAEATLKQVLARDPNHAGALGNLGYLYDRMDRFDEAVAAYERAAANPESAALARYTQFLTYFRRARFPEADRSIRLSVAAQPATNSQAGLAMLLITWKGDVEEAARVLASGPASFRNEPRVLWVTTLVHLARRQPEEALRTLNRLSDEFILDNWFVGPKAYWVGRAHAQAGRAEAARVAWEAGLALTRAKLKDVPTDRGVHLVQGELLALLDKREEALREARLVDELRREKDSWVTSPVRIHAALGDAKAALPLLRTLRAELGENLGWPLTLPLLRLDPIWDKLRDDPGFQELLQQPDKTTRGDQPGTPAQKVIRQAPRAGS